MSTTKEKVEVIIEKAAKMERGEFLVLPFDLKSHRASVRAQLYNAKKKFGNTFPEIAEEIKIRNITADNGKYALQICKEEPVKFDVFEVKDGLFEKLEIQSEKDIVRNLPLTTPTQENILAERLKRQLEEEEEL